MLQRRLRTQLMVILLAMVGLASGCGFRADSSAGEVNRSQSSPSQVSRWIVFLLDITLSYSLPQQALNAATQALKDEARPGDVWFFRMINARSYSDDAAIMTLRFPAPTNEKINPFDPRSKAKAQAHQAAFDRVKAAGVKRLQEFRLDALPRSSRSRTEIYGSLAKSGELLMKAPQGAERILIIASDLVDTESKKAASVDLSNVRVVVALFQSGVDVSRAQKLRRSWEEQLKHYGAREVIFLDPSEGWPRGCLSTAN